MYLYHNVIEDVKAYQKQNSHILKLADMAEVEKEIFSQENELIKKR